MFLGGKKLHVLFMYMSENVNLGKVTYATCARWLHTTLLLPSDGAPRTHLPVPWWALFPLLSCCCSGTSDRASARGAAPLVDFRIALCPSMQATGELCINIMDTAIFISASSPQPFQGVKLFLIILIKDKSHFRDYHLTFPSTLILSHTSWTNWVILATAKYILSMIWNGFPSLISLIKLVKLIHFIWFKFYFS